MTRSAEPLRIGLLGAAKITSAVVVEPARELGIRLVAIASRERSRAEQSPLSTA